MNTHEFDQEINSVFNECQEVLVNKGREYQSTKNEGSNVFANFERISESLSINRESVLWVYFSKHRDSISTFIRDLENGKSVQEIEDKLTEPINGRITDAINYLLLLNSMINEKRTEKWQEQK